MRWRARRTAYCCRLWPRRETKSPWGDSWPSSAPRASSRAPGRNLPSPLRRRQLRRRLRVPPHRRPPAAERIKASPLARKVAANLGIALGDVTATGTSGRIRARDVYACAERAQSAPAAPAAEPVQPVSGGALTAFPVKNLELMEGDTTERLTGMRKVVAQRMFTSHAEIPTVTQTMKVDVTELLEFRRSLNAQREQKLSVNDFILKAVAKALQQHPEMLVSLDGEQIIHRAHVNLGMAVAVEGGLLVPVIRDADRLGLAELAEQARDFASRGRNQQLTADQYKGSHLHRVQPGDVWDRELYAHYQSAGRGDFGDQRHPGRAPAPGGRLRVRPEGHADLPDL